MRKRAKDTASSDSAASIRDHFRRHQEVVAQSEQLSAVAAETSRVLIESLRAGGKIIAFGNGGSATQASHLAGELVGRFRAHRNPLPAIALSSDAATMTCIGNDFGYAALFERQMEAFVRPGDVAIGLTTSGKSENVVRALAIARARGAVTIALTGLAGLASGEADHLLAVPSTDTAHIQEVHLMLLHVWCVALDEAFSGDGS